MTFINLVPSAYVNVAQYGTVSDGVTDDAPSIQAAINAAPTGSTIFFPGNHAIGSTIQLVANRNYLGAPPGKAATIPTFIQQNGKNLSAMLASHEWYNNQAFASNALGMQNIVVDGNSANNTGTHGIVIQGYDCLIRNCLVQNVAGAGIVLTSVTANGTASANGAGESHIETCKVNNCGTYGIWGHDSNSNLTDCYIRDCEIATTGQDGILLDSAGGWSVLNNHLYGGQTNGINAAKCFATNITGNYIDGFAYGPTTYYYGIAVSLNGPRPTIISGNTITSDFEFSDSINYNYIGVFDNTITESSVALVYGNYIQGGFINTTSTTSITAGTTSACTPATMDRIFVGQQLGVDSAGNFEVITVASVTTTSFTPTTAWAHNHSGTYGVYSNKVTSKSIALTYQGKAAQVSNGYTYRIISYGNWADFVGQYVLTDSYTTIGPVPIDGSLAPYQAFAWNMSDNTIYPSSGGTLPVVPASAITAAKINPGQQAGETIFVVNQSAFPITFDVAANSHVADGAANKIPANTAKTFVWNLNTSLWYGVDHAYIQSSSAVSLASSGTITTAALDLSRVTTSGAVTGVILQAGTYNGQRIQVANESANLITFAASGTSNVAAGTSATISANTSRTFCWTGSLWY